ncbi:ATP-binding cassette domain-containing protein [Nitriliruptoraceae bacterium ZYF776]|nr:ATP-binding cassette domain-containing protein [Profundirhabdus halotolerans]
MATAASTTASTDSAGRGPREPPVSSRHRRRTCSGSSAVGSTCSATDGTSRSAPRTVAAGASVLRTTHTEPCTPYTQPRTLHAVGGRPTRTGSRRSRVPAVIEITALRKRYGDHQVLRGVDLTVDAGRTVALLGQNGAGKTTLVRAAATLLPFDAGTVRVDGFDVVTQAASVRGRLGLTGQYASVDELLTGTENLELLGRLLHLDRATARRRATELLERFDLTDAAGRRVETYSGGMRRRLDLAASLLGRPPVLILDEPTTGLDPRSRRALWEVVRELAQDGVGILLTTQYLDEADALADHVAVLHGGRIVTEGSAHQLKGQVGAERLTLRFRDPATRAAAAALLGHEPDPGDDAPLVVPVDGPRQLREVLDRLATADLDVAGVSLTAPTLDDVFLAVTADPMPAQEVVA